MAQGVLLGAKAPLFLHAMHTMQVGHTLFRWALP